MVKTVAYDDKVETVKQWNNDPCGLVEGLEIGSREFYEAVTINRYQAYAPWMPAVLRFNHYRGKHLLEVGFGMGTDLFEFARHGAVPHGIDLTPRHLEIATQRFALYDTPVDLRLGDAERLPYDTESFDVVYSFGVLHHTPNTQRALNEVWRVLKPGGTAIIGMYHRWSAFYLWRITRYIVSGEFRSHSLREALSRIEARRHSDARPLVKAYSRRELACMMSAYSVVHTEVHHLNYEDFRRWRYIVPQVLIGHLERYLGWYVIAFGTK